MDFKQIQELIKMINKTEIGELTIEQKDFKITIKQKEQKFIQAAAPQMQAASFPQPSAIVPQAAAAPQQVQPSTAEASSAATASSDKYVTIKSPMIGTFYRKPGPGKPNFVEVGDDVSQGKVVCIIEAMKLFNEIESEIKGKVVKILVEDSSPVEYDQPLFLVDPS